MTDMAATPTRRAAPLRDLRRDPDNGMVAGVCEGLGKRLDIDPLLLRIVFGATTLASGLGLVAYILAWILVPAEEGEPSVVSPDALRTKRNRRAALEVGLGLLEVSRTRETIHHGGPDWYENRTTERNSACATS